MEDSASEDHALISVESFYYYGYGGRQMLAIRAPFPMTGDGAALIGRAIDTGAKRHIVVAVSRQISSPIQKGEPIGVEIRAAPEGSSVE